MDVYPIAWRPGDTVIDNQLLRCMSQLILVFESQSERLSRRRGLLTVRALFKGKRVQMNAARSILSANKPCSSLARRNAVHCKLNLCKSSWICSTVGGVEGSLRTAFKTAHEAGSSLSSCALRRHFGELRQGCKVICAPYVGRLFHQSVVDHSGHDLCPKLLGTAWAESQKAGHHGNRTPLERPTENMKWTTHRINVEVLGRCKNTTLTCKKAGKIEGLKTSSLSDSDRSILNHSDDSAEFLCRGLL